MESFFRKIAQTIQRSLMYEVLLTPKPGLVDRNNQGAHTDMDIYTFSDSIIVLGDYFAKCTEAGFFNKNSDYSAIMDTIRPLGIDAEKDMFLVTNGVNTHKGAIFIFGILAAAVGSLKSEGALLEPSNILNRGGEISKNVLNDFKKDFSKKSGLTYGEEQFLKYGNQGIRGEAANGFPSVESAGKVFDEMINRGFNFEVAAGETLFYLMMNVFDSNVVGRGGIEALEFMKTETEKVSAFGGYRTKDGIKKIYELDKLFIEKNISPGGCADLCAAVIFVNFMINS